MFDAAIIDGTIGEIYVSQRPTDTSFETTDAHHALILVDNDRFLSVHLDEP